MIMPWMLLYLLTGTLLTCGAQEYYVTPTPPPNTNCPSHKPCHTLDYYARNASDLINGRENVSLLFLSGYHNSETVFEIANVDVLTIAGLDFNFQNLSTTIGSTRMLISNGTVFTLKNIAISYSTLNMSDFKSMTNYAIFCDDSLLSLRALQVDSILLTQSRLHQCLWLIYWGYTREIGYYDPIETAVQGISTELNNEPTIEISDTEILSKSNMLVRLAQSGNTSVHLNITFCTFIRTYGFVVTAHTVGEHLPECELVIRMDHCSMTDDMYGTVIIANDTHNVDVEISDSNFTAFANGSRTVEFTAHESTINATVRDSKFIGGIGIDTSVRGKSMFGFNVFRCQFMNTKLDSMRMLSINGGMIYALIEDCLFKDGYNSDTTLFLRDRVILIYARSSKNIPQIVLKNLVIENNHFLTGIIVLFGPIHTIIDNCTIKDNSASVSGGLLGYSTNVTFRGDTIFENNTGANGGATYLFETPLTFSPNLNLVFLNNKAKAVGGAIFVTETGSATFGDEIIQVATEPNPKCFYQLETDITNNSTLPSITFINNTAQSGGDNIYGAALKDDCTVTPNQLTKSFEIQNTLFHFQPVSKSSVSSSPKRVCACENGQPKCTDLDYIFINKAITPGEIISIEVVLVGHNFGPTTGGVFATEYDIGAYDGVIKSSLGEGEEIQYLETNKNCTTVHYSVKSNEGNSTSFILTANNLNAEAIERANDFFFEQPLLKESIEEFEQHSLIITNLLYSPIIISVELLPCPLGLEINSTTNQCDCRRELYDKNIAKHCAVKNNRTWITRTEFSSLWFRIRNHSENELVFEYARRCTYAYCNNSKVLSIDPSNPDSQCALNHSGVLCGGCAEGLSLVIGSDRCLKCPDNANMSFILVFLLLGVLLVLFIWILDLTISRGTINGLLFYVNMVSINREIFFVKNTGLGDTVNNCLQAAKVFIDWCNLDFGIESCFIYGLNATGKIWLQFVFPFYVWGLAVLIIVACKYSMRLTKLFGNNSISVLTTLFVIAYIKLERNINAVFSFADIHDLNGQVIHKVWYIDGNVDYVDAHHMIMCVVAGLIGIFLFILTIWLNFIKYTRKLPNQHKMNAIIDSLIGRLKRNHECWIGISLLTRGVVAILTILLDRQVVLQIVIFILFILGLIVSRAYKRIYLSLLEVSFITNLLIVSVIFLGETNNVLFAISISVSVLISALMFVGICIYHGVKCMQRVIPQMSNYLHKRRATKRKIKEAKSEQQVPKQPTATVVDLNCDGNEVYNNQNQGLRMVANFSKYREELLNTTEL